MVLHDVSSGAGAVVLMMRVRFGEGGGKCGTIEVFLLAAAVTVISIHCDVRWLAAEGMDRKRVGRCRTGMQHARRCLFCSVFLDVREEGEFSERDWMSWGGRK